MVLKELIFNSFTLGGCGGLEQKLGGCGGLTLNFLLWQGVVVLKELKF